MAYNIFTQTLEECGVKLSVAEQVPHVLTQEHPTVRCALIRKLSIENVRIEFLEEMKSYLQDDDNLNLAIMKTMFKDSQKHQKSLINLFASINHLQEDTLTIILEKLPYKILDPDYTFVINAFQSISCLSYINDEEQLAEKLLEMMDVADIDIKHEILKYFSLILSSINQQIAERLLTLVGENVQLAEPILECLQNLRYSSVVKDRILICIYNRLLDNERYYKAFPSILQLLFEKYDEDMPLILEKTRSTMDKIMSSKMMEVKLLLHKTLVRWTKLNIQLHSAILKAPAPEQHKPIDIYLLVLLYAGNSIKSKAIEGLIKRKIKGQSFSLELWQKLFDDYFVRESIEYFHGAFLDIALLLIESQTPANLIFGEIGVLIFKRLFAHDYSFGTKQQMMISKLRDHLSNSRCKNGELFLGMMLEMSKAKLFEAYSECLMDFVPLHYVLTTRNMKLVFEIVCENVVKDGYLIDNLRQDISKLLSNNFQQKKGVIGTITLAKYLATSTGNSTSLLNQSTDLDVPLTGSQEQATRLLDFAKSICLSNSAALGLFYDELAMCLTNDMSTRVSNHLHEDIKTVFEEIYVQSDPVETELRVPVKVQFDLNDASEIDDKIYINIGELAQNNHTSTQTTISILSSTFTFLYKITCFIDQGKVDSIDALLGCGVLLPDIEDVEVYGQADLPIVANCIFYAINWFRELVSAFVDQTSHALRQKVMLRVEHIITLEDKLDEVMALIPDHKLPQSYFYDEPEGSRSNPVATSSAAAKRARYDATINLTSSSDFSSKKAHRNNYYDFREMGANIMTLLKYPVRSENVTPSQARSLHSKQFQFILKDLLRKFAAYMNLRPKVDGLAGSSAENLLRGMVKLMPPIHKRFRLVARELFTLIENNEEQDSPAFFTAHANDLKVSFDLVINLYKMMFSWTGFQLGENENLFEQYLKYFDVAENSLTQTETQQFNVSSTALNDAKNNFIKNMSDYKVQCLLLSSAAALLELLRNFRSRMYYQTQNADLIIGATAKTFLLKPWVSLAGTPEHGREANVNVTLIISTYLNNASVCTLRGIMNTLSQEVKELKTKKDTLQTFRAIDKSNIHILIKCICGAIYAKLKVELATKIPADELILWQQGLHTMQKLIEIVKGLRDNRNLLNVAKSGLLIVNLFLKSGFPTIEKCLKQKKADEVQALFTTWEKILIFFHRLVCEVIDKKMKALLSIVPSIRAALEKFVLTVKKVLETSKCTVAFFEGVLMNKNLHGEQILTQSSVDDQDVEEDDLQNDFDIDFETDVMTDQSASEVFEIPEALK